LTANSLQTLSIPNKISILGNRRKQILQELTIAVGNHKKKTRISSYSVCFSIPNKKNFRKCWVLVSNDKVRYKSLLLFIAAVLRKDLKLEVKRKIYVTLELSILLMEVKAGTYWTISWPTN
jgi:hypothetical protein